jgi:hypothetical protein
MIYTLWYHGQYLTLDEAVAALFDMMCSTLKEYNASGEALCCMCNGDESVKESVLEFTRNGRSLLAGWYEWQIKSSRYGLQSYVKDDGSLEVQL